MLSNKFLLKLKEINVLHLSVFFTIFYIYFEYIYIYIYIYIYTHTHTHTHIYIYIYIYIVSKRKTVTLLHNSSVSLDTRDASIWVSNSAWSIPGLTPEILSFLMIGDDLFTHIFFLYILSATWVLNLSWRIPLQECSTNGGIGHQ